MKGEGQNPAKQERNPPVRNPAHLHDGLIMGSQSCRMVQLKTEVKFGEVRAQ